MKLLLVTGAGASRNLGVEDKQLPLMSDWANTLCQALDNRESQLASGCHLKPGMTGPQFEENLGLLLKWQQFRHLEGRFQELGGPNIGEVQNAVTNSRERVDRRLKLVMHTLNATLFQEFGQGQIDDDKAQRAYGRLLDLLDAPQLVFATTNYDGSAEAALADLGFEIHTGFRRPPNRTPTLDPEGLVERSQKENAVAAIHLHGAVGWYEQAGKVVEHHADLEYNPSLGTPVVLYPDPEKDPMRDAAVSLLWAEFQAAVDSVDSILVVGHSMHDPALVRSLREASQSKPVVVTYFNPDDRNEIKRLIPKAAAVPMNFGPDLETDDSRLLQIVKTGRAPAYLEAKA